jgi:hypothetical protein
MLLVHAENGGVKMAHGLPESNWVQVAQEMAGFCGNLAFSD